MSETKEIQSFTISPAVIMQLHSEAHKKGVSKSEIVEFALRRLMKLDLNACRNVLTVLFPEKQ